MNEQKLNHKRIRRMINKTLYEISCEDMLDSNFKEYFLSRFLDSRRFIRKIKKILGPIYRMEYNSRKEHPKYFDWELKPEYTARKVSFNLERYKAEETIEAE